MALKPTDVRVPLPVQLILDCHWLVCVRGEGLADRSIGGKVKQLQLFNIYLPLFQGTISNWSVDSKAISWTDVGYSFIISTLSKQVKGLELILSVSFVFGSCCCEPHHAVKGALHTRETDDC